MCVCSLLTAVQETHGFTDHRRVLLISFDCAGNVTGTYHNLCPSGSVRDRHIESYLWQQFKLRFMESLSSCRNQSPWVENAAWGQPGATRVFKKLRNSQLTFVSEQQMTEQPGNRFCLRIRWHSPALSCPLWNGLHPNYQWHKRRCTSTFPPFRRLAQVISFDIKPEFKQWLRRYQDSTHTQAWPTMSNNFHCAHVFFS